MCYYDRKEDYNCMISLKLMRKPDFRQSLELLMTVDMMIARMYCWIHAMMKHLEVAMILLLGSHLLISLARSLMMGLKYWLDLHLWYYLRSWCALVVGSQSDITYFIIFSLIWCREAFCFMFSFQFLFLLLWIKMWIMISLSHKPKDLSTDNNYKNDLLTFNIFDFSGAKCCMLAVCELWLGCTNYLIN